MYLNKRQVIITWLYSGNAKLPIGTEFEKNGNALFKHTFTYAAGQLSTDTTIWTTVPAGDIIDTVKNKYVYEGSFVKRYYSGKAFQSSSPYWITEYSEGNIKRSTSYPGMTDPYGEGWYFSYDNGINPFYYLNVAPVFHAISDRDPYFNIWLSWSMSTKNNLTSATRGNASTPQANPQYLYTTKYASDGLPEYRVRYLLNNMPVDTARYEYE